LAGLLMPSVPDLHVFMLKRMEATLLAWRVCTSDCLPVTT